eukprot:7224123-Prymnesium_polylepis.1
MSRTYVIRAVHPLSTPFRASDGSADMLRSACSSLSLLAPRRLTSRRLSSLSADERFDVIVVGGGILGAWAACAASKAGASVVLADQFGPKHEQGSSHGDGRMYGQRDSSALRFVCAP